MTKKKRLSNAIQFLYDLKNSIKNYIKSSFLSLVVIFLIFLLLTNMDQAFTLFVDLIENKSQMLGLFLSFFFVNTLAVSLSHYPIYNYYSANLNESDSYTQWEKIYPYRWPILRKLPVYLYSFKEDYETKVDPIANGLRYFSGFLIHGVWMYFILKTFERNLIFTDSIWVSTKWVFYLSLILPFIFYIYLKRNWYQANAIEEEHQRDEARNRWFRKVGVGYGIIGTLCVISFSVTLLWVSFSKWGLVLLLTTSYLLMLNYVFFRLARTHISQIIPLVKNPYRWLLQAIQWVEVAYKYLLVFLFVAGVALVYMIINTLGSIFEWTLPNALPILLAFFYFYYFLIANMNKYLFAAKKMKHDRTPKYFIVFSIPFILILLFFVSRIFNTEVRTHELDLVPQTDLFISEATFIEGIRSIEGDDLFFIASHGGGTKSNVWTLNVLNKLQQKTQGKLLEQTIAVSGASGGSLGVALYLSLFKENQTDYEQIQQKIDAIAKENFTSIDLTLTFGLDSYRKLWPLNKNIGLKDRPYYSMRKYQNMIEEKNDRQLSLQPFREYWTEIYLAEGYFPSLLMNTAATNGKRGILWSVKQDNFDRIFPFAENLADLSNQQTLPYYQAVSTTDRFPVFSPAAKIPGYGHYIDAGAIDNSGLLSCLDLHNYLATKDSLLIDKTIHYIEIINSKELYISYVLKKFRNQHQLAHIDINEKETDNIIADIQTGLNLDKIPGYIGNYLDLMEKNSEGKIKYYQIYMPHKVNLKDVEKHLNGKIINPEVRRSLQVFLDQENKIIFETTENPNTPFMKPWAFYEPTLSRHLSKSSLQYIQHILEHPMLEEQFEQINLYIKN